MSSTASRDDGLRRVSNLTRWAVAGAVVAAGVFSAAAARAVPGRAKASVTPGGAVGPPPSSVDSGAASSGATVSPADGSAAQDNGIGTQAGDGLSAPYQAPRSYRGTGSVSSGSS